MRSHTRGTAAAAGGGLLIIVAVLVFALWPRSSSEPAAPPTQVSATATTTPPAAPPRPPEPVLLANGLREHRERAGLTVTEAGRRAGLPAGDISAMENGRILPTASQIDTFSRVYGLTFDEWTNLMILRSSIP